MARVRLHKVIVFGRTTVLAALLGLVTISGCDEGLGPKIAPPPAGTVSGVITYRHWPPLDSLKDLRFVAFTTYPPTSILADVLGGKAVVYPPIGDTALIPFYVDSLQYLITLSPGTYPYVAVAQQYGPNVSANWRAVGQYTVGPDSSIPAPIHVVAGDTLVNVNISVDFAHPPPQPF